MYEIEKETVYEFSMLNLITNEKKFFLNLEELMCFLVKKQNLISSWLILDDENKFNNIYLDCFNETGYDRRIVRTYNFRTKEYDYSTELKPYMFFDRDNNLYDVRVHFKNLLKRRTEEDYLRRMERKPDYIFRSGPVPGTNKKYRGHFLRHVKTTNELRANSIPEHKEYIRSKRNRANLPTVYDDIPIIRQRSWKEKTKERHQWAKHFKGAKVPDKYKSNDFFNIDEEDYE